MLWWESHSSEKEREKINNINEISELTYESDFPLALKWRG